MTPAREAGPLAQFMRRRTRARLLLVLLVTCLAVALLITTATSPHEKTQLDYFVSSDDRRELWPSPTAEDSEALRSIPSHRPRRYSHLRLVFEFAWYNSLTNMEYAAISSFILAKSMDAEVLMPRGLVRVKPNEEKKATVPTRDIWDVDKIKELWKDVGLTVHEAGDDLGEDVHKIDIPGGLFWHLSSISDLREHVWKTVNKVLETNPLLNDTKVLKIRTANAHFALDTSTCAKETMAAVAMLPFSPRYVDLARTVVSSLSERGWSKYNGVHLRLEQDGLQAFAKESGFGGVLNAYLRSFDLVNLNSSLPMYAVTGLSADGGPEWETTQQRLLQHHTGVLVYLKNVMPSIAIDGIPYEQLSMVDMMVLAASETFVGVGYSTLSTLVALLRARLGYSMERSTLILPSHETDAFMNRFRRGAYLVDLRTLSLQ